MATPWKGYNMAQKSSIPIIIAYFRRVCFAVDRQFNH